MNAQQHKTIWILYMALLSSIVIYAVVAVVIDGGGGPQNAGDGGFDPAMLQYMFLALGAGATVMSFVIPGVVVRAEPGEALPYERLVTKKILQWAMSESIAIFGLVLYFMSGELDNMYIFAGWGVVVMLMHGPFGLAPDRRGS